MDIVDCAVTAWVDSPCSVPCHADAVGGTRILTREVVVAASQYGAACPALSASMRCNQIKCPVDCELSEWSSFSKCSKECGGGVQTRTRRKISSPENGGKACEVLQETQPCNTGSCDRDCMLSDWSAWGACSQACDGGKMTRTKKVLMKSLRKVHAQSRRAKHDSCDKAAMFKLVMETRCVPPIWMLSWRLTPVVP